MTIPEWVSDAVFYQIFPDRFANGDVSNDPVNVLPWYHAPTSWGFQGGDLRGITDRFEYLVDLGVNAIYLNPIFLAASNHRYNTSDYYKIDPKLGDFSDYLNLVEHAHRHNFHIVVDGVFNHCGRSFYAFADILENREHSPYRDWFHIHRFPVDAYSPGEAKDYEAWWGIKSLPKFNTANPQVRQYIFAVARHWIDQGADGWRLDVPNEINDDSFWEEFNHEVKSVNPQAYLLGEIWKADPRWVGDQRFDGLMNYPLREGILKYLSHGRIDTSHFTRQLNDLFRTYPFEHSLANYNLLGSHDTERPLTMLNGDKNRLKLAFLLQFAFPGAPAIYYGDEVGMRGGKDPDCRATFPWDETQWDHDLRNYLKALITARKQLPALRRGDFSVVLSDSRRHCMVFARRYDTQTVLIVVNADYKRHSIYVPTSELGYQDGQILHNVFDRTEVSANEGAVLLNLAPLSGAWLV